MAHDDLDRYNLAALFLQHDVIHVFVFACWGIEPAARLEFHFRVLHQHCPSDSTPSEPFSEMIWPWQPIIP
jgi:hypothetical protein